MPEIAYEASYPEQSHAQGTFDIIRGLDKNIRDISSELYIFLRETNRGFEILDADLLSLKKDVA